ncbi:peptide-methionine (S)-S-oxide reductase MsrA [Priestia aryabhattai]|uniref:peptide-methionine (S)-S-oxide reductase MsrA n=1 Tax=Priestia megaterium TaxID=1404 RepID=UPI0039B884F0
MKKYATFAGGCFWCMVAPFDQLPGIISIRSGYARDEQIISEASLPKKESEYVEAVQIVWNPSQITFEELLKLYWQQIDPTDSGGQFSDRGPSYRAIIFYHNEKQKEAALDSKRKLAKSGRFKSPIVTPILPFSSFYEAEEKQQEYYRKHAFHYKLYKEGSGRTDFLAQHWPKDRSYLKEVLTPMQYFVTQENGTEPPFTNLYWNNKKQGIYVDLLTGEALFKTSDQLMSHTGWPIFKRPILYGNIKKVPTRHSTALKSKEGNNYLGLLLIEENREYYQVNSAALHFIPKEKLKEEGYEDFLILF